MYLSSPCTSAQSALPTHTPRSCRERKATHTCAYRLGRRTWRSGCSGATCEVWVSWRKPAPSATQTCKQTKSNPVAHASGSAACATNAQQAPGARAQPAWGKVVDPKKCLVIADTPSVSSHHPLCQSTTAAAAATRLQAPHSQRRASELQPSSEGAGMTAPPPQTRTTHRCRPDEAGRAARSKNSRPPRSPPSRVFCRAFAPLLLQSARPSMVALQGRASRHTQAIERERERESGERTALHLDAGMHNVSRGNQVD